MFTQGVDYVYIPHSRVEGSLGKLRSILEVITALLDTINESAPRCSEPISKALCIHYFLPCGLNGSLHVPQSLCPDTCRYLTDVVCSSIWSTAMLELTTNPHVRNMGLDLPVCNRTSQIVSFLNLSEDCCSTGGVVIPSAPATTHPLVIIGSAVGAVLVAVTTIICALIMFFCWWKRKMRREIENEDMTVRYINYYASIIVSYCL